MADFVIDNERRVPDQELRIILRGGRPGKAQHETHKNEQSSDHKRPQKDAKPLLSQGKTCFWQGVSGIKGAL
jgi:hypothetical protein